MEVHVKETIWRKIMLKDKTTKKQVIDYLNKNSINDIYDQDFYDENELQIDTTESMKPENNNGSSTIEVLDETSDTVYSNETKTQYSTLNRNFFKQSQSVHYEGLYKLGDNKLKVEIKKDSVTFQSYARVSIFDTKEHKWNFLTSIPYQQMELVIKDIYHGNPATDVRTQTAFGVDIRALKNKAKLILL